VGEWFGHSELLTDSIRKARVTTMEKSLLLCLRKNEIQRVMGSEYLELFKMYAFDYENL
jgi:hypothetical protein